MPNNNLKNPKFQPAFGLKNPHLQTLYPALFRKSISLKYEIENFEFDDGDFVECYWHQKPSPNSFKPIVVLFHGLEGSYKSPYIQGIMSALSKNNFSSVLMHFRGCSGKINRLPRAYHSGDTADAKLWIEYLKTLYPNNPIFAIGYSLGGNMLLKLLGEWGENSPLQSAVSVSAPMDLNISADTIDEGFSKIYQKHLLRHLKGTLLAKYRYHPMKSLIGLDEKAVKKLKTIRCFDEIYTAKIHDFGSAKKYYKKSSAKQYLKYIQTPTLIIHSLDDPFMTEKILPNQDEISDKVKLEVSQNGGHVGFISGSFLKPKYWLEGRIINFFKTKK